MQGGTNDPRPSSGAGRRTLALGLAGLGLAVIAALVSLLLLNRPKDEPNEPVAVMRDAGPADMEPGEGDGTTDQAVPVVPRKRRPPEPTRKITDGELRALQRTHHPLVMACYRRAAGRAGSMPASRANVLLRLGARGHIRQIRVEADHDPALEGCIRRVIRGWRFSPSLKAQQVTFSLMFR